MAGHSKWKQIKRKKAINDQKRGALFTRLIREVTVAARSGGGDPELNARLRLAVDTAKAANMPAENIERAIQRGTGELEGVAYEEISYEAYGPGGVALFIEATTDNSKRTVAEIRHALERNGGNLGTAGSVAWQFQRKGQIYVDAKSHGEEAVLEAALEAGADDVVAAGDEFLITTAVHTFPAVQNALRKAGITVTQAELAMIPQNEVDVAGTDAERLLKLLDFLDGHDDIQKVSTNANIDEQVLEEAMS